MPESKSKVNPPAGGQKAKVQVKRQKLTVGAGSLSVPVFTVDGKEVGVMALPKSVFGVKVNNPLLDQAVRVYLNNTKGHFGSTKTRSEVKGSTRKIRAQKGTGGARHGSVRAPIFVGGGIALGPKFRRIALDLPQRMKKAALASAFSSKMVDKEIVGVKGLDKMSGKTAQARKFLEKLGKKNALFVVGEKEEMASRAVRNLPGVDMLTAEQVNILEITGHRTLFLTQEAAEKLEFRIKGDELSKKIKAGKEVKK